MYSQLTPQNAILCQLQDPRPRFTSNHNSHNATQNTQTYMHESYNYQLQTLRLLES